MKNLNKYILLALVSTLLWACNGSRNDSQVTLAKVFDKYLYLSDVEDIFPTGISPSDSALILNAYVDQWVRRQLLVYTAERNLDDKQKNVAKQLEDYRSSLLIFKYEQEFVAQRMDTVITTEEIESFYKDNQENFTLSDVIVKALYLKIPKGSPYLDKIRTVYKSKSDEDVKTLEDLAYQVADKYDYFNDKWIQFAMLQKKLPYAVDGSAEAYLRKSSSIEMEDGDYVYLVHIRSVLFAGNTSPLEYEQKNIESVLFNRRKQRIINELENRIYNDARNRNQFTIF
ncbi:MAG: hypothetical protein JW783_09640 [Bacteroidales bacterium]|nr:hypothetical protein [Bacteroidales bacterium]MBN2750800.1 hypothetical protein [Bacteroidales bacterium]